MTKFIQNDNNYAIAYYRRSSSAQNEASTEQQRTEAHRYAEQHGYEIIEEYVDEAISGTTDKRPGYQKMLNDVSSLKPSVLIIWKTDRLGRDKYDLAIAKKTIKDAGCKVCCVAESIPDDTPEAIIMEGLLESMAAYYSRQLSTNVTRGMRSNAEKCLYNGNKIIGYMPDSEKKNRNDKHERHYILDPLMAPVVKEIFDLYVAGDSMAEICRKLNGKGLRTLKGNEFVPNSICGILKNRAYIGEYKYDDIIIPGGMPQIVSNDVFDEAQKLMLKNKRCGAKNTKAYKEENPSSFWLTGKIYCAKCKSTMHGISGTSKSGKAYYYYTCDEHNRKSRGNGCQKCKIRKDALENIVTYLIQNTVLRNNIFRTEIAASLASYLNSRKENNDFIIESLKQQQAENNKAINNIMRAIIEGATGGIINEKLAELDAKKIQLENSIDLELVKKKLTYDQENIKLYFDKYMDANMDNTLLRDEILEYYIDGIFVDDDEIYIEFKYPYLNDKEKDRVYNNVDLHPYPPVASMPVLIDDSPKKKNRGCNDVAIGECSSGYTHDAPTGAYPNPYVFRGGFALLVWLKDKPKK